MQTHSLPALNRGIWRKVKNTDIHRFKPESLHGNLLPLQTNGVMTLCKRMHDDMIVLVHATNIEPVPHPREAPTKQTKPVRPTRQTELKAVKNILDGLL